MTIESECKGPRLAILLAGTLFLAGCMGGPGPTGPGDHGRDWKPPGLDASNVTLPPVGALDLPPGPFKENPADLQSLEEFLRNGTAPALTFCGAGSDPETSASAAEIEFHFDAIDQVFFACNEGEEARAAAPEAMEAGNEEEILRDLVANAQRAFNASQEAVAGRIGPSSATEAQFLWRIMDWQNVMQHDLSLVENYWIPYEDGRARSDFQLAATYRIPLSVAARSNATMALLEGFPWKGEPCQPPDVDALIREIQDKVDRLRAIIDSYENATNETHLWVELFKGKVERPFQFFAEHRWWEGLLSISGWADIHLAYWAGLSEEDAWPTLEEARGMLAWVRHGERTIWTERVLAVFVGEFEKLRPRFVGEWVSDVEHGAANFYATIGALSWPYADLAC